MSRELRVKENQVQFYQGQCLTDFFKWSEQWKKSWAPLRRLRYAIMMGAIGSVVNTDRYEHIEGAGAVPVDSSGAVEHWRYIWRQDKDIAKSDPRRFVSFEMCCEEFDIEPSQARRSLLPAYQSWREVDEAGRKVGRVFFDPAAI